MKDYHINIFYNSEDEGYIADIPDWKYCSAFGETPEAALQEVQIAKAAWLEAAKAEGKTIPEPKYRPAIYQVMTWKTIVNKIHPIDCTLLNSLAHIVSS